MKQKVCIIGSFFLSVLFVLLGTVTAGASKLVPVSIGRPTYNLMKYPDSKKVQHRGKTYSNRILWIKKTRTYKGSIYYQLTNKKYNLGYINAKAVYKINKPRLYFSSSSNVVNQGDPFNVKTGSYKYIKPDKVNITWTNYVNTDIAGKYIVVYHVKDTAGYRFDVKRFISVKKINLIGIYNPSFDNEDGYKVSTVGETLKLKPQYTVAGATAKITWQSSDSSVASVNPDGRVYMRKDGIAVITASLRGKCIKTPVMVTESSHLRMNSSDDLVQPYFGLSFIDYAQKGSLRQYVTALWETNGERFIYADTGKVLLNQNSDSLRTDEFNFYRAWPTTDESVDNTTGIMQTVDELGNSHQYLGGGLD